MTNPLMDIRIVVSPDVVVPKRVLSEDVPVTPEFRQEVNDWMLRFFGSTLSNVIADGQVLMNYYGGIAHMNPRTYAALKSEASRT